MIRTAVYFASALIGIIAADVILSGFHVDGAITYLVVAIIVGLLQAILSPIFRRVAERKARAFMGGVGLVTTFVSLVLTSLFMGDFSMDGVTTWILSTLVVWLFTAIAAFILPLLLVRKAVAERRA